VGEMSAPYAWSPNIVDMQLFRVGNFFIIVSPSEATTMAGRRWKSAVVAAARPSSALPAGAPDPIVVLGGPANTYSHYAATAEEYGAQRYEGASTLFGKFTLDAYINLTVSALPYLAPGATTSPPSGPDPPDNRDKSLSFIAGVVQDNPAAGKAFGQCTSPPPSRVTRGAVVNATFVGANPRNNLRLEGTYAAVERKGDDGRWSVYRDDADWSLVYSWRRTNWILGWSEVDLSWETATGTDALGAVEPGRYRFKYYGDAKAFFGGKITGFEGTSGEFDVV
jgi:neutral ceramidase